MEDRYPVPNDRPEDGPRPDPADVARIVNVAGALTRERLAAGRDSWLTVIPTDRPVTERDIERIVAVLAELAERMIACERLADYAAERVEAA